MGFVLAVIGLPLIPLTPVVLIVGLAWILVGLGLEAVFAAIRRRRERLEALRDDGVPGVATILEATPTNKKYGSAASYATGKRVWRFRLRIEAEGIATYELEKGIVPKVGPSGFEPGRKWPVFVDRQDNERFLVDWEKLQAAAQRIEVSPGLVVSRSTPQK